MTRLLLVAFLLVSGCAESVPPVKRYFQAEADYLQSTGWVRVRGIRWRPPHHVKERFIVGSDGLVDQPDAIIEQLVRDGEASWGEPVPH
jgi:hypothetical protein